MERKEGREGRKTGREWGRVEEEREEEHTIDS